MKRRYSFKLYVPATARTCVLRTLRTLCHPDAYATIDQAIADLTINEVPISLLLEPEPAVAQFAAWFPDQQGADGKVQIGYIYVAIKNERIVESDALGLIITLSPAARTLGWVCIYASQFRDLLVEILETCQGIEGSFYDGEGYGDFFWTADEGRRDAVYPPYELPS